MVTVRPADSVREAFEVPSDSLAREVDSFAYLESKQLKYNEAQEAQPISAFRAYSFVEVETGFEEKAGDKTVVYVDPKNLHLPESPKG